MITADRISQLMYRWIPRLYLEDWHFEVHEGSARNNAVAETELLWRCKRAKITIPLNLHDQCQERGLTGMRDSEDDSLTDTIVHELVHVMLQPAHGQFTEYLSDEIGSGPAARLILKMEHDANEYAVNQITRSLLEAYRAEDEILDSQDRTSQNQAAQGGTEETNQPQAAPRILKNAFAILDQNYNVGLD